MKPFGTNNKEPYLSDTAYDTSWARLDDDTVYDFSPMDSQARRMKEEAKSKAHESHDLQDFAVSASDGRTNWSHDVLGRDALSRGNLIDAMFHFQNELARAKVSGTPERIAEAATDLAYVCAMTGSEDRAGRLYELALAHWMQTNSNAAVRSPRVMSAFALFLYDYAAHLTAQGKLVLAARAHRRLSLLAKRYSAFTVYSALSNRLRCRGQLQEAASLQDLARKKPINQERHAYTQEMLSRIQSSL